MTQTELGKAEELGAPASAAEAIVMLVEEVSWVSAEGPCSEIDIEFEFDFRINRESSSSGIVVI